MSDHVNAMPADDLDGHTLEELGEYLDRGRTPVDPSIENSPGCRLAMANLTRLRELAWGGLRNEARLDADRDDRWIRGLLDTIKDEVTPGRDIPVAHDDPTLRLAVTEASVRTLIRRAGDTAGGVIVGRCTLVGDVTIPGEDIRVEVTASLEFGQSGDGAADRLRRRIARTLARHTELAVTGIDILFDDVYLGRGDAP